MKTALELFLSFSRIGALTFGGGYAMIPMMEKELVEKKNYVTNAELLDYYAVSQCTPGIIAVNTATFVGHKIMGFWGAVCATLGVVFPSVVIITLIAALLTNFASIPAVMSAFAGIRVCVCVLIFNAVLRLWKTAVKDRGALILFLAVFLLSVFTDISPVAFVILCALSGVVIKALGVKEK